MRVHLSFFNIFLSMEVQFIGGSPTLLSGPLNQNWLKFDAAPKFIHGFIIYFTLSLSSSFLLMTHCLSGLLNQNAQKVDGSFANEVTNHLFEEHSPKEQTRVSNCTLASHTFSQCAATTCNFIFSIFSQKGTTYPYLSYLFACLSYDVLLYTGISIEA